MNKNRRIDINNEELNSSEDLVNIRSEEKISKKKLNSEDLDKIFGGMVYVGNTLALLLFGGCSYIIYKLFKNKKNKKTPLKKKTVI
ncbi:MAG: hypothetical protein LBK29_03980 [Oscillospiraceae bacterium]|jgi:hypothetical protein|nr:hypothetical protein [Oscillospiraceae bacterium]